ncbi:MAG: hypothetical protein F6J97_24470, partial [Leptolyngbya sp. SIO4C1]|nr:hypothetical protein [Leptolyngbya sp. SIO4C1]
MNKLSAGLKVVLMISIVLGIIFRFDQLGSKLYWEDEAFTSLRVAGYTRQALIEANFTGHLIDVHDLKQFQSSDSGQTIFDTIKSLADDVHPPLYFVLLRVWASCFGNSIALLRSFSALMGCLLIACLFLLTRELSGSIRCAWF